MDPLDGRISLLSLRCVPFFSYCIHRKAEALSDSGIQLDHTRIFRCSVCLALILRAEIFFRLLPSSYIRSDTRGIAYRSLFGALLVRYLPGKIWGIVGQAEL